MAKLIECGLTTSQKNDDTPDNCQGIIAHQIGKRMIDIKRDKESIVIVGDKWSAQVTCPKCHRKHAISCEGGTIDESELLYRDPKKPDKDESLESGEKPDDDKSSSTDDEKS